ncbi:hypothetical protein AB0D24_37470 [Streptomyces javensis]|uniref:hypothetical protein n=1 Tax=Streptomyces javensis TaxID=114698 RepID=UPI0033DBE958
MGRARRQGAQADEAVLVVIAEELGEVGHPLGIDAAGLLIVGSAGDVGGERGDQATACRVVAVLDGEIDVDQRALGGVALPVVLLELGRIPLGELVDRMGGGLVDECSAGRSRTSSRIAADGRSGISSRAVWVPGIMSPGLTCWFGSARPQQAASRSETACRSW